MRITIFNTPILSKVLHYLARIILKLTGWQTAGSMPDLPKFVLIGAPHTSNWDFLLFLALMLCLRSNIHYMGKSELFRWPIGIFFRYCGGIPVNRSRSNGLVEQMTQVINESKNFILAISPEGTRYKVDAWKSGFYHIAKGANVPVVFAFVDGVKKIVGIGPTYTLTDDINVDLKAIRSYYAGIIGINPGLKKEVGYVD